MSFYFWIKLFLGLKILQHKLCDWKRSKKKNYHSTRVNLLHLLKLYQMTHTLFALLLQYKKLKVLYYSLQFNCLMVSLFVNIGLSTLILRVTLVNWLFPLYWIGAWILVSWISVSWILDVLFDLPSALFLPRINLPVLQVSPQLSSPTISYLPLPQDQRLTITVPIFTCCDLLVRKL